MRIASVARWLTVAANIGLAAALLLGGCVVTPVQPPHDRPHAPPADDAAVSAGLALQPLDEGGTLWRGMEFAVATDRAVTNPFDPAEIDLRVRFTSPQGETLLVPAFRYQEFDRTTLEASGEPGWRARFTPTAPGAWTARAELDGAVSAPVTVDVAPDPDARGFVRLHPADGRYFAFDDGSFFLPIGPNVAWGGDDVLGDYERWLDRLSQNGGNAARIWMASWSFAIEWDDTGLGDYTHRLRQAWLLDQVFRMAEERGIYLMLTLLNHGAFSTTVNPEWAENPYNADLGGPCVNPQDFITDPAAKEFFQRRLRYIAARWAYSPNLWAWEWWNEVNWTPITDDMLAPWMAEMTEALHTHDPYRHLITHSVGGGSRSSIWSVPELDFAQVHDYSGGDLLDVFPAGYAQIGRVAPGKAVVLGELGYASAADEGDVDAEGIHVHDGIWAAPFTGYASTAMHWWWDSHIDAHDLWPHYRGIAEFLREEELAGMVATTGVVTPDDADAAILRAEDRALVWIRSAAYSLSAKQAAYDQAVRDALRARQQLTGWTYELPTLSGLTLAVTDLPDGVYAVRWFSPQTSEWLSEEVAEVIDGSVTLPLPDFNRDLDGQVVRQAVSQ